MSDDWTDHYFVPNGIVTYEDCPACGAPDMRVEHGKSGRGSFQHFEHCTECGDSMPIVCYDCIFCGIILEDDMKPGDWLGFSADTAEADVRKRAAAMLDVPEEHIEVKRTSGAWLAQAKEKAGED